MLHHNKPKPVKDALGVRGYAGLSSFYNSPCVRGNSSLAKSLLRSENFDNQTSQSSANSTTERSCHAHELPAAEDFGTGLPSLGGNFILYDENQSMKKPDVTPVNTFDSPEDKTAAAKKIKQELAVGGVPSTKPNLFEREKRIEENLKVFESAGFEIGRELIEIQREAEYAESTFEEYVKNRWGWKRQRGYELMEAFRVKEGLPENVISKLQNPGQALALKAAPKEKRAEILESVSANGKASVSEIKKAVKEERQRAIPAEFEGVDTEVRSEPENVTTGTGAASESHSVDDVTGEILECASCQEYAVLVKGLEGKIRGFIIQIAELRRDKERDAKESGLWDGALKVFSHWKKATKHEKSKFSLDRFELIAPFLREDGVELCIRAVDGLAYDPYISNRKNGTKKKHDDLELAFRSRKNFEESTCKAPLAKKK